MQPPPLPDEPTVRCQLCGQRVPESEIVRERIDFGKTTGYASTWSGTSYDAKAGYTHFGATHSGLADICLDCQDEQRLRRKANDKLVLFFLGALVVAGAIIIVVLLALMLTL